MKEPTIRRYLLQILQGLTFLHNHGKFDDGNSPHRQLRAFVDSYGLLKITDFGLRRCLLPLLTSVNSDESDWARKTMAPEALRDFRLWGEKTDVWCVGLLTLQMANGLGKYPPQQTFEQSKDRNRSLHHNRFQPSDASRFPTKKQVPESPELL
ncbi:STE/STE11 protein kinase, partial [Phytophthora megakarya]